MKNSFALLGTGDEVDGDYNTVEGKGQKKDKPVQKKPVEDTRPKRVANINANLPSADIKEDHKVYKHDREQKPRDVFDHRSHDRQSANQKPHEARKQGGGAGNIGNLKDELNQDRILAKIKEDGTEETSEAPKEPQKPALSLEQYYQQQGYSIESVEKQLSKEDKQKKEGPIEAEWIAKEKLTLMKTKEDTKNNDQQRKPAVLKDASHKVEAAPEQELLGFKSGLASEPRKPREEKQKPQQKGGKAEGKKGAKPVISEEDFPAL